MRVRVDMQAKWTPNMIVCAINSHSHKQMSSRTCFQEEAYIV